MSVLDKKLLVEEITKALGEYVPTATVSRIADTIGETLERYSVERTAEEDGVDESEGMVKLFIDAKRSEGKSEKTLRNYTYVLNRLHNGAGALNKMTVFKLRAFISSEMERGVKPSSLESNRSVYCNFFSWLKREEIIDKNPCDNLAPIKPKKEVKLPYEDIDVYRLQDHATNPRDRAIIALLRSTGCRVSEAAGANRDAFNVTQKRLTVLGKGNKERILFLDDECILRLTDYLKERTDDNPALFVNYKFERIDTGGIRLILRKIAKKAGVDGVHPHRFRRTLATNLINHGMPVQDVAAVLGHDKLDTTMGYVYQSNEQVEQSYRRYA